MINQFLLLRLSLAAFFIWFGIDKFLHPSYWTNTWLPHGLFPVFDYVGISLTQMIYLAGIFEILTAISLTTTIFAKSFSGIAAVWFLLLFVLGGFSIVSAKDLVLVGGLATIVFSARQRSRF